MKYSYTKASGKTIFTKEFQLLFAFFSVTIFMLFATHNLLLLKNHNFEQDMAETLKQKDDFVKSTEKMKNEIAYIEKQVDLSEEVFTKNSLLKDSISNLFDLVPGRIVLSEAKIMENGLILYGITPNQDVYNFMLLAPLRSIFHQTYSSFYPAENGWLRFVSTNYLEEETVSEE
ncbi:hypothetical protein [Sulfurimonas sp.]|uniref:hypothetical protein n=1 Tax=Sulfurimonas sp. TaxID=2022749 RepID=UPI00260BDF0A|nr:hypothetical protein [Sulfurimonas sp.]MDD5157298.1 hypothetical protein [Sulfurimonas sp.]